MNNSLDEYSRLWYAPDSSDVYAVGVGDTQIATGLTREHARRIVACVNACIGVPTAQLEAMNAQQIGLLARAYDVCSEIVEDWRHELEDDAVNTLSRIGEDALTVCRWALTGDNGLPSNPDFGRDCPPLNQLIKETTVKTYIVLYRDDSLEPHEDPFAFFCEAEDANHAEEQCGNAYPGADIVWVYEGACIEDAYAEYWDI